MTRDVRETFEVQKENELNIVFLTDSWKKRIFEMQLIFILTQYSNLFCTGIRIPDALTSYI